MIVQRIKLQTHFLFRRARFSSLDIRLHRFDDELKQNKDSLTNNTEVARALDFQFNVTDLDDLYK